MKSTRNRGWLAVLPLTIILTMSAGAQDSKQPPVWWFGIAGAANLNFYGGTLQHLNPSITTPVPFHKGFGAGLYLAPTLEYRPDPVWGGILQLGYDDRRADFDDVICPCGEKATLSAKPAYISLEPSLRIAPFAGDFHLFAGPRVGVLWSPGRGEKTFHYTEEGKQDTNAEFSDMRKIVFSGQIGMGYDFNWNPDDSRSWIQFSPFVSYQPPYGEAPRYSDHWGLETVRVGAALKIGFTSATPVAVSTPLPTPRHTLGIRFSVEAPEIVVDQYRIQETFPLRNYVYFEEGSNHFSDRYVTLTRSEAVSFREEQLQDKLPSEPTGRSRRQMVVYRNILNIVGDRLRRNPGSTITLNGMAIEGPQLGRERAESVKRYLVEVFGIDGARIQAQGVDEVHYGHTRGPEELAMLGAGNQRVEIVSQSSALLVQVGEGDFMLKPVQLKGEADGTDSVVFHAIGAEKLSSWWLDITDDQNATRRFGPFYRNRETLPAAMLLGDHEFGVYSATLTGQNSEGDSVSRQASFRLSRRNHGIHLTTRFAILFDFDRFAAVSAYEKFLAEFVTPEIPDGATVYVRGRTDVIGETDYNLNLSHNRAASVESDLTLYTRNAGRRNVTFQSSWTGEDTLEAPFGNATPEERAYNRTVVIDIIPY